MGDGKKNKYGGGEEIEGKMGDLDMSPVRSM